MGKSSPKTYYATVRQVRDPFNEFIEFAEIDIHEDILKELGWNENTDISCTVKLGPNGNVLVLERVELDKM